MMVNKLKAHFKVYAGHWELAGIIMALILGGVICGYFLRGSQARAYVETVQAIHQAELDRMQDTYRATIASLTHRLADMAIKQRDVAAKQQEAARRIDEAARAAKAAASTARTAAKNAANANIRRQR